MARSDPHLLSSASTLPDPQNNPDDIAMAGFNPERLLKIPPPSHGHDIGDPASSPPPGTILLDPYGYLSCRTNGTTAEGLTRDGRAIQVTFWVSTAPRVSYFTFHCPDFRPSMYGNLPKAIYSEDDLVLFRVPIVSRQDDDGHCFPNREDHHYFVYQAGTKNTPPSLHLVPIPDHLQFNDRQPVLLRCRDEDMFYYLALLTRVANFNYDDEQYDLHLYDSKTRTWNTKLTSIIDKENFNFRNPDVVLTIGGESGTVGWVDLWRGILIRHLLLPDNHILRYIPLPLPLVPMPLRGHALYSRNIIVVGDYIKFFEMVRVRPAGSCTACAAQSLVAATKKMKISDIGSSGNNSWEEDCSIKFSEIPVDSLKCAQMLLPSLKLQVTADTKLTLKGLSAGYPVLSMQDADVVYIMRRPYPDNEDKASVIAVDMRNKTIKDVAHYFGSGRCGYNHTYIQSGISKYLNV